jgi:hypothetical protein
MPDLPSLVSPYRAFLNKISIFRSPINAWKEQLLDYRQIFQLKDWDWAITGGLLRDQNPPQMKAKASTVRQLACKKGFS